VIHASDRWESAILIALLSAIVLLTIVTAQRGRKYFVRRIPGLNAIDEAVGRATEMGRPILMVPGLSGLGVVGLQALTIFSYIIKTAAQFGNRLIPQLLRQTVVADNGYFMANAHIAHDCLIEDGVTMCNNATLGGHTTVMRGATLGFGATVHQYQVIGAYSMLGMGTIVPKHIEILPGEMYAGNPAKHIGPNIVGLERAGITAQMRKAEHERYRVLRRQW